MGATHQCIVKWPGWMSSKEAMGHVSSFMFGHFLLSGPKRNMYPRCGNTFWQDSMSTYQKWGGGSDPPGKQSQVIWVIFNPTFALQPRRGRRVAGSTSCARWQTLNLAMTRSAFKGAGKAFLPLRGANSLPQLLWHFHLAPHTRTKQGLATRDLQFHNMAVGSGSSLGPYLSPFAGAGSSFADNQLFLLRFLFWFWC